MGVFTSAERVRMTPAFPFVIVSFRDRAIVRVSTIASSGRGVYGPRRGRGRPRQIAAPRRRSSLTLARGALRRCSRTRGRQQGRRAVAAAAAAAACAAARPSCRLRPDNAVIERFGRRRRPMRPRSPGAANAGAAVRQPALAGRADAHDALEDDASGADRQVFEGVDALRRRRGARATSRCTGATSSCSNRTAAKDGAAGGEVQSRAGVRVGRGCTGRDGGLRAAAVRRRPAALRAADALATTDSFDGSWHFCRLAYSGGAWSTDYPDADYNFSTRLSELTKTTVSRTPGGRRAPAHRPAHRRRAVSVRVRDAVAGRIALLQRGGRRPDPPVPAQRRLPLVR